MTKQQVRDAIRAAGMTGTYRDGEWRVNFPNGREATAYYTTDDQDAIDTAKAMAQEQEKGA